MHRSCPLRAKGAQQELELPCWQFQLRNAFHLASVPNFVLLSCLNHYIECLQKFKVWSFSIGANLTYAGRAGYSLRCSPSVRESNAGARSLGVIKNRILHRRFTRLILKILARRVAVVWLRNVRSHCHAKICDTLRPAFTSPNSQLPGYY